MRRNHLEELKGTGSDAACQVNGDEMTECSIYDATCLKERNDTTFKRQRKVFSDTEIRVRFLLRNPLLTDIAVSNLRLRCRYVKDKVDGEEEAKGVQDEKDDDDEYESEDLKVDAVEM